MEDEIKINEYVRTKDGHIAKYIEKIAKDEDVSDGMLFDNFIYEKYKHIRYSILKEIIVKHSKIISEVVEIGDYVNGKLIHKIDKGPNYCYLYYGNCKTFVDYQIQTILTKEQMEANQYVVK